MYELLLHIEPVAKGRPRFSSGHIYTPVKTKDFEMFIAGAWFSKYGGLRLKGPIAARLEFGVKIPKSTSKKQKALMLEGKVKPDKRPDLDNYIKAVLDGLNMAAFDDDGAITNITASKLYADRPYVLVVLDCLNVGDEII